MAILTQKQSEMIGATVLVHRELDQILAIIVAELCSGHSPLVLAMQMELMRLEIAERFTNASTTIALGDTIQERL